MIYAIISKVRCTYTLLSSSIIKVGYGKKIPFFQFPSFFGAVEGKEFQMSCKKNLEKFRSLDRVVTGVGENHAKIYRNSI